MSYTTIYTTYVDFTIMVDWNLDGENTTVVKQDIPDRPNRRKKRVGPIGKLKSRPLMESKPRNMVYSGAKKQRKKRPTVRKVKRDSNGDVLVS